KASWFRPAGSLRGGWLDWTCLVRIALGWSVQRPAVMVLGAALEAARESRGARVAQPRPDDGLPTAATPGRGCRRLVAHRWGRWTRGVRMRRVRRRAAALAFSRWSSPLLLK